MRSILKIAMCGFCLLALGASGCGKNINEAPLAPLPGSMPVDPPPGSAMLAANTYAGDALAAMLLRRIDEGSGIMVAAFTDMENTDVSSPFGRVSMQQVSSRVAQHGFRVMEMRLGDSMRINREQGELILTRDAGRLLAREHNAHAVLVGMYSRSPENIYVSTRVVRLEDSALLAAYEYYIPYADDSGALLSGGGGGQAADSANAAVWDRYGARGAAFASAPASGGTAGSRQAGAVAPARVSARSDVVYSQSGIPETFRILPGGKMIDPAAPPPQVGKKKR